MYGRSKPSDVSPVIRTKEPKKKPPKTKRYEGKLLSLNSVYNKLKLSFNYIIICVVDETGKKIRGKADGNIKDYDHYGKRLSNKQYFSLKPKVLII